MDRRTWIKLCGLEAGALAVGCRSDGGAMEAQAVRQSTRAGATEPSPDVVVVGAGAFGGWTALYLARMGHRVTLIDAYGPGNARATSGGLTRLIRHAGNGAREIYTKWAIEAYQRWQEWQERWGERLLLPTGRLTLAPELNEDLQASKKSLDKYNIDSEIIGHDELRRRYPQMNPDGVGVALFEPGAGTLFARRACLAVGRAFQNAGGTFRLAHAKPGRREGSKLVSLDLTGGETVSAQAFVFACGPWLKKMFPRLLGRKLSTPRRNVFFWGPAPGDQRFSYPNLPNFSDSANRIYGMTSVEHLGFKVCPIGGPADLDAETEDRFTSEFYAKKARDYLALRFPALRDQPIIHSRACQLEDTPDAHFIIDKHPEFDNVWLAGGGSGHGFKHGPVVGEYVAKRVTGQATEAELDDAFRLGDRVFG